MATARKFPVSSKTGYALLLVVASAALYGQFLWNPIVFDDLPFFMVDNQGNQPVSSYHFSLVELRSLPYATLAWTKDWFGLDMIGFRIGNLLLHAASVLALFYFLEKLFGAVLGERNEASLSPRLAAFFSSLLFALHPVAVYAAGYLVQRTIVMATLFSLLAMLAYVQGSVRNKPLWLWASVPLYYLAVFAKEHAIMLPVALLALTILLHADWLAKLKQRWGIFLALVLIAVTVVLAKRSLLGSVYEIHAQEMPGGAEGKLSYPLSVMTQSWLFFKYAWLWLFPNPDWVSVDMREPFARLLFSPYLAAAGCFALWGACGLWLLLKRGRAGLAGFALLFPWLMFFTEFSSVRIQEIFVLYRSYFWAAGAFCLLPAVFARANARVAGVILTFAALAMFVVSMERLATFSHPVLLWDDAEKLVHGRPDLPGSYRIYYNRGTEYIKIDQYDRAISDLKRSIELFADQPPAHGNLGRAYIKKGEMELAVRAYNKAIQIGIDQQYPPHPKHYLGRANAYEAMKNWAAAAADYEVTCRLVKLGCDKADPARLMSMKRG